MFRTHLIIILFVVAAVVLLYIGLTFERKEPYQLPIPVNVVVKQKSTPVSSSLNITSEIPSQKSRSDLKQYNVMPTEDPSPETLMQNDKQYLLPYGVIDKSFIFSVFFPLVSMWFPCPTSCSIQNINYSPLPSQSTILGATDNKTGNLLGYLVLVNNTPMTLTQNPLLATPVLVQGITDGGDISATVGSRGGQYIKTSDGTRYISIDWSSYKTSYTSVFVTNTQTVNSLYITPAFAGGVFTTIQYTDGTNGFAVLGFSNSNAFMDTVSMSNTISTSVTQMQIGSNKALSFSSSAYLSYNGGILSIVEDVSSASSFSSVSDGSTTYILDSNGVYLDVNPGTQLTIIPSNTPAMAIDSNGLVTVAGKYLAYQTFGDALMGSFSMAPLLSENPGEIMSLIPNPCYICTSQGQTQYNYRPVPYKINRIICREKTVDNTGINNYAFTIDATSGLQCAYIKKYLLGLGAVLVTAETIIDDQLSLKQELTETSEAFDEYQKGYSDGFSKGSQMVCTTQSPSDNTISDTLGDVSTIVSVASLFL